MDRRWYDQDVQQAMMMTVDRDNWMRFVGSLYGEGLGYLERPKFRRIWMNT